MRTRACTHARTHVRMTSECGSDDIDCLLLTLTRASNEASNDAECGAGMGAADAVDWRLGSWINVEFSVLGSNY